MFECDVVETRQIWARNRSEEETNVWARSGEEGTNIYWARRGEEEINVWVRCRNRSFGGGGGVGGLVE
jgi:hypothetical protein